jgi:uncharacterized membrane protein
MWSREELKSRAKSVLRKNYWHALVVSIVIALAGGNNSWGGSSSHSGNSRDYTYLDVLNGNFIDWSFILIASITFITLMVIILAFRIFIGYSLEVGGTKYFVQSAQYKDNKKCFRYVFDEQNYTGIIKTMLLTDIFIFLWSLLLIIPGIIKSYSYKMVPYILADNPTIGVKKAIALSNDMTMGHKFDMFVLDLSFIGWYLLGIFAFGIGVFFVMPYENATSAELYLVLRKNALENNLCSYEDLLLNQQVSENNNTLW